MSFTTLANVCNLYPTFQRGVPNQKPPDTLIQQTIEDFADVIIAILERRFNEAITAVGTIDQWLISLGLPNKDWAAGITINAGDIVLDSNDPMSAQQAQGAGTTGTTLPVFASTFGGNIADGTVSGGWNNIGQTRQLSVLERGNRYGSASQIGRIMSAFGVTAAAKLADEYNEADWQPFRAELNAEQIDKRFRGQPKDYGMYDALFDPLANVQTPRPLLTGIAGGDQPVGVAPDQEAVSAVFGKFGIDFGRHSQGSGWPTPGNTQ